VLLGLYDTEIHKSIRASCGYNVAMESWESSANYEGWKFKFIDATDILRIDKTDSDLIKFKYACFATFKVTHYMLWGPQKIKTEETLKASCSAVISRSAWGRRSNAF